jgi:hypothetical protein
MSDFFVSRPRENLSAPSVSYKVLPCILRIASMTYEALPSPDLQALFAEGAE